MGLNIHTMKMAVLATSNKASTEIFRDIRPAGLMVRRLTSDQEIAGSSPASVTVSFFLFCLSYPGSSMIDSKKANFTSLYYCSGDYYTVILTRSNIRRRKLTDEK